MQSLADSSAAPQTPAEARALVEHLERKFTVECGYCIGGYQYNGDPAASTDRYKCTACNGSGRRWPA